MMLSIVLVLLVSSHYRPAAADPRTIVLFGDVQYDPFYGTANAYGECMSSDSGSNLAKPHCASSKKLVEATISDIRQLQPAVTIFTGSTLRPTKTDMSSDDYAAALASAVEMLAQTGSEMLPAIGVTDLYQIPFSGQATSRLFGYYKANGMLKNSNESTALLCGFYTTQKWGLFFIHLNTLLWSPLTAVISTDPCEQLKFLEKSLAYAKQQGLKAIIVGNIPLGWNVPTLVTNGIGSASQLWSSSIDAAFRALVKKYQTNIALAVFGYYERQSLILDQGMGVLVLTVPAISPYGGNNPTYLVLTIDDRTGAVSRLRMRLLLDGQVWTSPSEWQSSFGIPFQFEPVFQLVQRLTTVVSSTEKSNLAQLYFGRSSMASVLNSCDMICQQLIVCSMVSTDTKSLQDCFSLLRSPWEQSAATATTVFTVISSFIFLAALTYLVWKRRVWSIVRPVSVHEHSQKTA